MTLASYAIGPITGPTSTCVGGGWKVTVSDVSTGGTYKSSNPLVATVTDGVVPGTGVITGVAPGYCTITYSCACGGPSVETATMTFIVNDEPTITGPGTVCDGGVYHYKGYPNDGQWTVSPTTIAQDVDPVFKFTTNAYIKFISTGAVDIRYTIGGCYAVKAVTSNPSPMCIYGPSTVKCGCSCPETYTCTSPGGVWSSSDPSIADISSSGVVSCHKEGCVDIIYTLGGCPAKKKIMVTTHDHHHGSCISGNLCNNSHGSVSPESDMEVNFIDAGGNIVMSTITDASGNYSLTDIPDGTYTVSPAQDGYSTTTSEVNISATNLTAIVNFLKNTNSGRISPTSVAGVHSVASTQGITVFPNPTSGNVNIKWENQSNDNAAIVVTDVTGQTVYTSTIAITQAGQAALDLNNLRSGLYLISVKSANISYNGRLLISK